MREEAYLYFEIQSLYASVECLDRKLDPDTTNLMVVDQNEGTILDVTKTLVKYRNYIPQDIQCSKVKPRVKRYIEKARDALRVLLKYFSSEDIHPCSMTGFMVNYTPYYRIYGDFAPSQFAEKVSSAIYEKTGLRVKAGFGTNMYLARVAADLVAGMQGRDNAGVLTEGWFYIMLWDHTPLTDFYDITYSMAKKLAHIGVTTMRGISELSLEELRNEIGDDADLLWEHSIGKDSCTMRALKYAEKITRDLTDSRVMITGDCNGVYLSLKSMVSCLITELNRHKMYTGEVSLRIEYQDGNYSGARKAFDYVTCSRRKIDDAFSDLYWLKVNELIPIMRINIAASELTYIPQHKRSVS